MNAVVIEHVQITELPEAWRGRLALVPGTTVTVRIEAEAEGSAQAVERATEDPLFGMWHDREDMADVASYIRSIRSSRFNFDETQR
jgi:hypothetical protein